MLPLPGVLTHIVDQNNTKAMKNTGVKNGYVLHLSILNHHFNSLENLCSRYEGPFTLRKKECFETLGWRNHRQRGWNVAWVGRAPLGSAGSSIYCIHRTHLQHPASLWVCWCLWAADVWGRNEQITHGLAAGRISSRADKALRWECLAFLPCDTARTYCWMAGDLGGLFLFKTRLQAKVIKYSDLFWMRWKY